MVETTYRKKKIYVPAEEKIGLKDGDKLTISLVNRKSFKVELKRKTAEEKIINALTKAKEIGVPKGLTNRIIYDNTG